MKSVIVLGILITVVIVLSGCLVDVDELKVNGPKYFSSMGYDVLGYEGYQRGVFGGKVWFFVRDRETGFKYSHYLIKRGGEYHWYYGTDHQKGMITK